jgi:hypothetical protein
MASRDNLVRKLLTQNRGHRARGSGNLLRRRANFEIAITVVLAVLAAALVPRIATAHGGLDMDHDVCKLHFGLYSMHFSGYQPQNDDSKEFCEDIPTSGKTIIVLDQVNSELREMPVEVRIVKAEDDFNPGHALPLVELPLKVYPAGTVHFEYDFQRTGQFVGYVRVGDPLRMTARFPFRVGRSPWFWPIRVGVALAILGFAVMLAAFGLSRGQRRVQAHPA